MAEHAAKRGRNADRATDIAAKLERREPRGHGRRSAARAPTGRACQIPRIIRAAEKLVVRLPITRIWRQVGLTEDDRARGAEAAHRRCIFRGTVARTARQPAGGWESSYINRVFDGDGQAK